MKLVNQNQEATVSTVSLLLAAIMILSRFTNIFCKRYFVTIIMKVPSYE